MGKKIIISTIIAFLIGYSLGPPDLISQLIIGFVAVLLCCVPLLILARFNFVKSSSNSMHTLVCVLVCVISVLSVLCVLSLYRIAGNASSVPDSSVISSSQDIGL